MESMDFTLEQAGTITECRETLNAAIKDVSTPAHTEHESVVRAIASYVVQELLDPPHTLWADAVNRCRAAGVAPPAEPTCAFAIACTITLTKPAA